MGIQGIENLKSEGSDYPRKEGDFLILGPECFTGVDGLVISYKGENYYKACGVKVTNKEEGGSTHCVRRVGHPGLLHEDYYGAVSTGLE